MHLALAEISSTFEEVNANVRFDEKVEVAVFRIGQELVSNIIRRSEASIQLIAAGTRLQLIDEDNGVGFEQDIECGHGLFNMEMRAKGIGGTLSFEPTRPSGSTATLRVPIDLKAHLQHEQ
jgi:signal transduction histidine kinase